MITCEEAQEIFTNALYGELDAQRRRAFDAHLAECPECAEECSKLTHTIRVMNLRERPEPDEAFWSETWNKVGREIEPSSLQTRKPQTWIGRYRWAWQVAAAAALVIFGVAIERQYRISDLLSPDHAPEIASETVPAPPTELDLRVDTYLERSKRVLMGLSNLDTSHRDLPGIDFSRERRITQDLVAETRYLKQELDQSREDRLLELIAELEVILLQISKIDESQRDLGVELARIGIHRGALLFKINLEEMKRTTEKYGNAPDNRRSQSEIIG
jgi:hypothetical protein